MWKLVFVFFMLDAEPITITFPGYVSEKACEAEAREYEPAVMEVAEMIEAGLVGYKCELDAVL